MALTDKDRDELLARISSKIESSAVLNGGFGKLVAVVETIKERQEEQNVKMDTMSEKLFEPKDGLFSRVLQLENDVRSVSEKVENHNKKDGETFAKVEKHLEKIEKIKETAENAKTVTDRLQRIGGEDLQDLKKGVDLNKRLTALYWSLVAAAVMGGANLLWQFISHR